MGIRADQQALYVKDMYKAEYATEIEVPPMYDKIYKVITSGITGAGHKETQLLGAGDLEEHTVEGQDITFKTPKQGWSTYAKYITFSDGLTLTKEAVQDTVKLGDLLKKLAGSWGESIRVLRETKAAQAFNDGGDLLGNSIFDGSHIGNADPSGLLLYDSKPLFTLTGNKRTTKGGGQYYNSVASITLDPDTFATVYHLHTSANNRNELDRVVGNPADTLLTRTGAEHDLAKRILESEQKPFGELNDINVNKSRVTAMAWDYLNDGTTYPGWYVGKKQHAKFQWHERQAPEIDFFRDPTNRGYKASVDMRFGPHFAPGAWRAWTRGGGTSA